MLRTLASSVGLSSNSMLMLIPVATRICSHHSEGAAKATTAPPSAPTASMINTRSSDMISAMPSRKARLSQSAQELSPSQSVKFTSMTVSRRGYFCDPMVPVWLKRTCAPSSVRLEKRQLDIEGLRQVFSSQRLPQRSSGDDASLPQQHAVRDARRNLLDMMCDEDCGRRVLILGKLAEGVNQRLAAGKI